MSQADAPRVSILIPNYNNGRASSVNGDYDFITKLLESLAETLSDDPTPCEIIAYDDGSSDDSLETLRNWAARRWPDGRPFLDLIEAEHCGVLARTANVLSRRARGDIFARLDGDVVCLTRHWASRLCEVFDGGPERLGVVGPKQLSPTGQIHAFGDWILHPNGYTHIAAGLDRYAVRHPTEVDHVMGSFYCCKKEVFDALGGYDEDFLRGQTIDFGLRARLHGWSCIAVPQIEYLHAHGLRAPRETRADSIDGVVQTLDTFERKWGFSRLAPDLDEVRRRYAGTPLLWNQRWFGSAGPADPPHPDRLTIESTDWGRFAEDQSLQQQLQAHAGSVLQVVEQTGVPELVAQIETGAGLLGHFLALKGLRYVGTDRSRAHIALARQCVCNTEYPRQRPEYKHQNEARRVPLADGQADLVLIVNQLERHANPVALLREARRISKPGKHLVVISRRKPLRKDAPTDTEHPYRFWELVGQIKAVGGWAILVASDQDGSKQRDMLVVARRLPDPVASPTKGALRDRSPNAAAPESIKRTPATAW